MRAGSIIALNTTSRGASNSRVMRISRSEGSVTLVLYSLAAAISFPLVLFFQVAKYVVELIEALVPGAAVGIQPGVELLGDLRLAQSEPLDDLSDGEWLAAEEFDDLQPVRFRERAQDLLHRVIYTPKRICLSRHTSMCQRRTACGRQSERRNIAECHSRARPSGESSRSFWLRARSRTRRTKNGTARPVAKSFPSASTRRVRKPRSSRRRGRGLRRSRDPRPQRASADGNASGRGGARDAPHVVHDRERRAAIDLLLLAFGEVHGIDRAHGFVDRAEQVRVIAAHDHVIRPHHVA